jgi:ATP-binding cassette subfamily F protein 3
MDSVLGRNQPRVDGKPKQKVDGKVASKARADASALKKAAAEAELRSAQLAAQCEALDQAMSNPHNSDPKLACLSMSELSRRRAQLAAELAHAETRWLEASELLERQAA